MTDLWLKSNSRELATILAALRHWQKELDGHEHPTYAESIDPDHFAEDMPLDSSEINALCERLNSDRGRIALVTLLNSVEADLMGYLELLDLDTQADHPAAQTVRELHAALKQIQPSHACGIDHPQMMKPSRPAMSKSRVPRGRQRRKP